MLERVRRDSRSVQTRRLDQSDERRRSLDGAQHASLAASPEPDRDLSALLARALRRFRRRSLARLSASSRRRDASHSQDCGPSTFGRSRCARRSQGQRN